MNVIITLTSISGNKTLTVEPASCIINRGICNDSLQHRENSCDVNLVYEPELYAFIVEQKQINATLKNSAGATLFTGVVSADAGWTDEGNPFPLRQLPLTIKDYTSKLNVSTSEEIAYLDILLSTALTKLSDDCGLSIVLDNVPTITLQAFVIPSGRNYLQIFDMLCYQYGLTFYFDQLGRICFLIFT